MATGYVLGALSEGDARAFAAFLETSPAAQREVADLRELLPVLASAIEGPRPSASLRARVLAHATRASASLSARPARGQPLRPARPLPVAWIALAASLIALIGMSLSHMRLRADLATRDSAVATLRRNLAQAEAQRVEARATLGGLLDTHTTYTRLTAQGNKKPDVRLFCNWQAQVAFASAAGLTPNSVGRVYQLWFLPKAGAPIPSVTFTVDAAGNARLINISLPENQEIATATVTDEPTGGSPQPTTTPFLVGSL
jgi:anti-sigma-K factor RskA